MIIKQIKDHKVVQSETCGEIREILSKDDYSPDIALAINIGKTQAHYHTGFDEIYFLLKGKLKMKLFNPATDKISELALKANELCVITKGIHYKIVKASRRNRLCVISVPNFSREDEVISDII